MLSFTKKELVLIEKLNTPAKVQNYLNSLKFNFEEDGKETLHSPIMVMRKKKAHCFEGALLGAYILSRHGYKPLLLHLKTAREDLDHVITLFRERDCWGALSKTNHAVLRYREPVYKNVRELVLSYFHEYFLNDGRKTLRQYSRPLSLNVFEKNWHLLEGNLWGIDKELDKIKHYDIAPKKAFQNLRRADKIEIEAGKIEEYKKKK
jgi:hypothetical protein